MTAAMGVGAVCGGLELAALAFVGGASITFMSTGNSTLQLRATPMMRGRVMSLWFVAFQGSTPIGGPLIGWVMAAFGARAGLGLGAVTCWIVAMIGWISLRRLRPGSEWERTPAQIVPAANRVTEVGT